MTIDQAITDLMFLVKVGSDTITSNELAAIKLGIEALKFRLRLENAATKLPYRPLLGETKD